MIDRPLTPIDNHISYEYAKWGMNTAALAAVKMFSLKITHGAVIPPTRAQMTAMCPK
jgi:hypothetical protein